MVAKIIDGRELAEKVLDKAKLDVAKLAPKPCLAIVLVGDNPASIVYTNKKHEACKKVGIESKNIKLPENSSESDVIAWIRKLNADNSVDGILVQVPLPGGIDEDRVLAEVAKEKDVDGFQPENFGKLALGLPGITPCTPKGVIRMLKESGVTLPGKHAVVMGRSRIVGKPLALLLLNENCTVSICHSRTKDVGAITRQADIVCVAVGKPKTLTADMVKEGTIVIDAGTNREGEKLVGDVDFDAVKEKASMITPVPGGVGPMTIAMLIENTVQCYKERRKAK
ncbi:MAG: bifunctional 5,10-methylenetetrahydrofolate dehydrogenase/5,10-methenyltetrahydrofolate cyclohydrolase [Candidatus Micrarchaeota archaeon]|nr:bifunctional 5,10-methylenetetrahydrofolate dehydrogenase/5,10-methenyltetrahydrofolate cyclohydrolase [Candidatus Micrarchaeota archaeon]